MFVLLSLYPLIGNVFRHFTMFLSFFGMSVVLGYHNIIRIKPGDIYLVHTTPLRIFLNQESLYSEDRKRYNVYTTGRKRVPHWSCGDMFKCRHLVTNFRGQILNVNICLTWRLFGHCVVCPSSIYGFWLPLWYLQTLHLQN